MGRRREYVRLLRLLHFEVVDLLRRRHRPLRRRHRDIDRRVALARASRKGMMISAARIFRELKAQSI